MSGTRLGRLGLATLRERLSDRDLAVVASVDQFRLLTARQIEVLHFVGHATPFTAARVCRRVLERLTRDRLLVRLQRRIGGIRAGSASYVYALGPVGHRLLHYDSSRRWREPSEAFVHHTLAVAALVVELVERDRADEIELVEYQTEPHCWRTYTAGMGATETLKPDLSLTTADSDHEYRWFLEMDLGTESSSAVTRKCRVYTRYHQTGIEQHRHQVFPKVLWIAVTQRRADLIERALARSRKIHHPLFAVTTTEEAPNLLGGDAR